jgi:hypothetical protein
MKNNSFSKNIQAVVVNHNTSRYTELLLRSMFAKHTDCSYLLFLDTDVCFLENDSLDVMLQELQQDEKSFAISPRITSNAESEIAREYWSVVYNSRLHPCCALVKNTDTFQRVVAEVGLSCVQFLWAHGEEYFDTFRLMTQVMKTHGFRVIRSAAMVQHFFCVAYEMEPQKLMNVKAQLRDKLLEGYLRSLDEF